MYNEVMKKGWWLGLILLLVITVYWFYPTPSKNSTPKTPVAQPAISNKPSDAQFSHIFIIVEENKPYGNILGNSQAPYINHLAAKYTLLTNYYAVAHPSLPNYIALTSGTKAGITNDCSPPSADCEVDVKNIADLLESANKSWKQYAEGMPKPCYAYNDGRYVTRHNPFVYYQDIIGNPARCWAHVVPFSQLATDLKRTNTTPDVGFITPDVCNDMHDCSVTIGDAWLKTNVTKILRSPAFANQNSLLVVTWDEDDGGAGNHVAAILAGPEVKAGHKLSDIYSLYSLLKTIEQNWQLPALTSNDMRAAPLTGFTISTD